MRVRRTKRSYEGSLPLGAPFSFRWNCGWMNAWMLSVTSLVGSGTATAQDAAETRNSSTPGSRLWLLRIHPPHSGERFGGEVRLFCTLLSTPRPLFVEEFLEHLAFRGG